MSDLAAWAAGGLVVEAQAVMTATAVTPAARAAAAVCRAVTTDDDWAQSVELRVRCHDGPEEPAAFRAYATAQAHTRRVMVEAGHGGWFGAFADGSLACRWARSSAVRSSPAFSESVETRPDHRRRGLARALVGTSTGTASRCWVRGRW